MTWISALLIAGVIAGAALELLLGARQIAAVERHRDTVPAPFAASVTLDEHRKAADYTIAKARFGRLEVILSALVTLALTLGGGIGLIDTLWRTAGFTPLWLGTAVVGTIALLVGAIHFPLTVWRTFRLEARFGFNRTTPMLFLVDLGKGLLLAALLGGPVLLLMLTLTERAGRWWWLGAWILWLGLMILMTWAWPALIAPLFNRFSPLADAVLENRVETLLERCGFASKGVFVVDSSRRSSHGNAYFTGIGRSKRIVFFDTLLARLEHAEIEAVLAHELGHFKLKHVRKRLLVSVAATFAGFALLGWLAVRPWFYASFGVAVPSTHAALILFALVVPVFTFFLTPIGSLWSRRHEFEADAFAARHASAKELAAALVKLYRDNANTLTPDPAYAAFFYSHPSALVRISRLARAE